MGHPLQVRLKTDPENPRIAQTGKDANTPERKVKSTIPLADVFCNPRDVSKGRFRDLTEKDHGQVNILRTDPSGIREKRLQFR